MYQISNPYAMNKPTLILYTFLLLFLNVESQEYLEMMNSEGFTVQETQNAAKQYFEIRGKGRGTGYKTFKRWEYNAIRMQDENGFLKSSSFYINELERYNSEINNATPSNQTSLVSNWEQLGPTTWNQTSGWNPGVGRITSIAFEAWVRCSYIYDRATAGLPCGRKFGYTGGSRKHSNEGTRRSLASQPLACTSG